MIDLLIPMTPISMFEIQVLNSNPGLRIYALSFETYLNSDKPQNREKKMKQVMHCINILIQKTIRDTIYSN